MFVYDYLSFQSPSHIACSLKCKGHYQCKLYFYKLVTTCSNDNNNGSTLKWLNCFQCNNFFCNCHKCWFTTRKLLICYYCNKLFCRECILNSNSMMFCKHCANRYHKCDLCQNVVPNLKKCSHCSTYHCPNCRFLKMYNYFTKKQTFLCNQCDYA